jgi:hypothetical protein
VTGGLLALAVLMAATAILLAAGRSNSRTSTVTAPVVSQHSRSGLVAADVAFMAQQDAITREPGDHAWLLGYRVAADASSVDNWVVSVGRDGTVWARMTVGFRWSGGRWVSNGFGYVQPLSPGAGGAGFTPVGP